jgi:hypothetical protein
VSSHFIIKTVCKFFFLFALAISSCKEKKKNESNITNVSSDTVIRHIPEWFKTSTLIRGRVADGNKALNLSTLQNGFDGTQIRIWIECNIQDTQHTIIITNYKAKWEATFYYYKLYKNEDGSFKFLKSRAENRVPKSGWEVFTKDLLVTGIENLPDYEKMYPKYNPPTDASAVTVEIGNNKEYRLYQYPELGMNKEIKEGPAKLEQALLLIEREFGYKRPCQNE